MVREALHSHCKALPKGKVRVGTPDLIFTEELTLRGIGSERTEGIGNRSAETSFSGTLSQLWGILATTICSVPTVVGQPLCIAEVFT